MNTSQFWADFVMGFSKSHDYDQNVTIHLTKIRGQPDPPDTRTDEEKVWDILSKPYQPPKSTFINFDLESYPSQNIKDFYENHD